MPSTTLANLETFLAGTEPSLAVALRLAAHFPAPTPSGVDPSFFRLVILGFTTYDHQTHPEAWVPPTSRVEFIREWATWAFETETDMAHEDSEEPEFFYLHQIVEQFEARQVPFVSSYMVDYFDPL